MNYQEALATKLCTACSSPDPGAFFWADDGVTRECDALCANCRVLTRYSLSILLMLPGHEMAKRAIGMTGSMLVYSEDLMVSNPEFYRMLEAARKHHGEEGAKCL